MRYKLVGFCTRFVPQQLKIQCIMLIYWLLQKIVRFPWGDSFDSMYGGGSSAVVLMGRKYEKNGNDIPEGENRWHIAKCLHFAPWERSASGQATPAVRWVVAAHPITTLATLRVVLQKGRPLRGRFYHIVVPHSDVFRRNILLCNPTSSDWKERWCGEVTARYKPSRRKRDFPQCLWGARREREAQEKYCTNKLWKQNYAIMCVITIFFVFSPLQNRRRCTYRQMNPLKRKESYETGRCFMDYMCCFSLGIIIPQIQDDLYFRRKWFFYF